MGLRKARRATHTRPFYEYPEMYEPYVLRSLEEEVWAAIRPLAVEEMSRRVIKARLRTIKGLELRETAAKVASCVRQADEYFSSAVRASPRTSPLLHYYSMLNLAKALVYIEAPEKLLRQRDFLHGITDPNRMKNRKTFALKNESLTVQEHGVFGSLYHVLTGQSLKGGTSFALADLLEYCAWVTSELEDLLGRRSRLIHVSLKLAMDADRELAWVKAEIPRDEVVYRVGRVSRLTVTARPFLSLFERVASEDASALRYETPALAPDQSQGISLGQRVQEVRAALRGLRLYRYFKYSEDSGEYVMPLGDDPLPEPCVLLGITFYLGSLVRYQPHIYDHLLGTNDAYLLESFISQCPLAFAYVMLSHLWRAEHIFRTV